MALPGVQRSSFEVGVDTELSFPPIELEGRGTWVTWRAPAGTWTCGLELETDDPLTRSVSHQ